VVVRRERHLTTLNDQLVSCGNAPNQHTVRSATSPSQLLSVLAERRLEQGQSAELAALIADVLEPPLERIGALAVVDFLGA
jgi:hypothetical protein